MPMELQRLIADFMLTAMIILSSGIILYPLTLSAVLGIDKWRTRHGVHGSRDIWRTLTGRPRRVPAQDQSAPVPARFSALDLAERRRHMRLKTSFLGTLHPDAASLAANICDVLDLSASGARIRPVDPMPDAPLVTLGIDRFGLFPAQVVWRHGGEVGLQFLQSPVMVAHSMRGLVPTAICTPAPIAHAA